MFLKQRSSFVLFMHRFVPVLTVLLAVFSISVINLRNTPVAHAATNNTVNFQARLQSASGAIVPDGNYNIEFKLYGASSGGTALWTEDHYNSGSNGLRTVNGYFSTKLGSVTAFPSTINWDQELWLTMNVGGTTTGTPTLDGEMDPRLKLTAVPYAISAGQLQTTNGSYTSKLGIQAPTGGNQVFQIQDQGATGTYNILTAPSGSDGYLKLQGSTPGTQQTGSFNISGTGIAGTLQASDFDRASSGTLTFGNTNATTINIGTNNSAHTVNIANGTGTQTVTLGSTSGSSTTIIQGGTGGVGLYTGTGGTVGIYIGGNNVLAMDTSGRTVFKPITDDTNTFSVQDSGGGSIFAIQSSTGIIASCATCTIQSGNGGFLTSGGLTFQGTTTTTFRTPGTNGDGSNGANLSTKINIPIYDPGAFNQIIALGLPGSAASTARAITIADARSSAHQPTIAVLSPDENQIGGFSWDGSNSVFQTKSTTASIALGNSGGAGLTLTASGNSQTVAVGTASSKDGAVQFNNSTNSNTATIQATGTSTSYITNLPAAIGSANQCLAVSSVASGTQQLGYADCLTTSSGIRNQTTQQTANFNIVSAASGSIGGVIQGAVGQSVDIFQVKSSGGINSLRVGNNGAVSVSSAVAGSVAFTISGATSQTGDLIRLQDSSGNVNGAFNAGGNQLTLGRVAASGTVTQGALVLSDGTTSNFALTLQSANLTANRTVTLPNETGTICLQNSSNCGFLTASNGVQLQASTPGTQQTGNLNISGTGIFGTALTANGNTTITATSTAALKIQNASSVALLTADTSTGTITLGNSGSGNYITFTAGGGLTAYGTSQHGKSIVYSPEYTNAVLDAASDSSCSSANNGTLTSLYDSTNYRNYYNWTSTQGTNQCYDVIVDVVLPNDFSSWASSDPLNLQALASNTSNAGYAIAIRNVTGSAWDGNYGSSYASPGSISTSWTDVASSSFSGTYNAGDRLSIKIRMTAKSSANLQLGNLTLNYNSKW